ncbi:Uncharacterised protein [Citrobacter koseri]|nr:Uncharacterised protein [Citrobacter koseri]
MRCQPDFISDEKYQFKKSIPINAVTFKWQVHSIF